METDSFLHEQEQEALTFKGETAGISALPFITLLDGALCLADSLFLVCGDPWSPGGSPRDDVLLTGR